MLDPKKVAEVKRLLAEGLDGQHISQRQIAILVGVSRGSVGAIASGKRPDYTDRQIETIDPTPDDGPKVRCLGCGGLTSLPCRVCRDRETLQKARRQPGLEQTAPDSLNSQLRPEDQKRYEKIHQKKRTEVVDQTADAWQEPKDVDHAA